MKYIVTEISGELYLEEKNPYTDNDNYFSNESIRYREFEFSKKRYLLLTPLPAGEEVDESEVEIKEQVFMNLSKTWETPVNNIELASFKRNRYQIRQVATIKEKADHIPDNSKMVEDKEQISEDVEYKSLDEEYCKLCFERGGVKQKTCNSCLKGYFVSPSKDREQSIEANKYNQLKDVFEWVIDNHINSCFQEYKDELRKKAGLI